VICSSRSETRMSPAEELVRQGSPLLIGAGVVSSQHRKRIALGLIGNHRDDIAQVFALRGELDHGSLGEVAHLDALENVAVPLEKPRHARDRRAAAFRVCVGDL
jgi:hypothetical protein